MRRNEQQNSIKNLESKSNIKIDTKEINKHKNITTDIISNELTEEEKNIITKEILEDFEEDKLWRR